MEHKFDFDKVARNYTHRFDGDIPSDFFDQQRNDIFVAADRCRRRTLNRFIATAASIVVVIAVAVTALVKTSQPNRLSTDEMIDLLIAESTDAQLLESTDIADAEMMFDTEYYN
ncbi:MAG: hypothetical protein K2I94_07260 [Muribaculaceae bacterium]|nr:hypothetical protein [Muribaculaceae bacterium]